MHGWSKVEEGLVYVGAWLAPGLGNAGARSFGAGSAKKRFNGLLF